MSSNTKILITGANRGIGHALSAVYLARSNTTLIAGVRNPNDKSVQTLATLQRGNGSKLVVVKIESASETDAKVAVELLKTKHGISKLDTVIANAGIGYYWATALKTSVKELQEHYLVNSIAPLVLLQETFSLLDASEKSKFIVVSSVLGSIGAMDNAPLPATAYGSSKAALNYTTKKIHQENTKLIAFAVHPGWIPTKLGNAGANSVGMPEAPDTMENNIPKLVSLFDNASRESTSGQFFSFDGTALPW